MMPALLAALALQAAAPAPPRAPVPDPCQVDRRAMLALGMDAFDQDLQGGWRRLSERPGCEGAAAGLIRDYREFMLDRIPILLWHEGQLRANLGETEQAIRLLDRTRRASGDERAAWWNPYVDGTIAFLRGDRAGLAAARSRLAAVARPADTPAGRAWPPNLAVLDGLIHCFGRPYREANAVACRPPAPAP